MYIDIKIGICIYRCKYTIKLMGLCVNDFSPTLLKTPFRCNFAGEDGGGLYLTTVQTKLR